MEFNNQRGMTAENKFAAALNNVGIPHHYADTWYDFSIRRADDKEELVEVKSTSITIKDAARKWRVGRFDFTNAENKRLQQENNAWVCLVVRIGEQYTIWGFVRARQITQKRYLTLHKAMELSPLTFDKWLARVNKK